MFEKIPVKIWRTILTVVGCVLTIFTGIVASKELDIKVDKAVAKALNNASDEV